MTHSDDLEYGGAATYVKFIKNGYKGYHVLSTRSNSGTGLNLELEETIYSFQIPSNKIARIRKQEQLRAGKWLGTTEHIFMDFKESVYVDRRLKVHAPDLKTRHFGKDQPVGREPIMVAAGMEKSIKEAEEIFMRLEPEITLTMTPFAEANPDHTATGLMAIKGFIRAAKRVKLGPMYVPMNLMEFTTPYVVPPSDRWTVEVGDVMEQVFRAETEWKCQRGRSVDVNKRWAMGLRKHHLHDSWNNNLPMTEMTEEFWKLIDWEEAKELEV